MKTTINNTFISACLLSASLMGAPQAYAEEKVIAVINGQEVTNKQIELFFRTQGPQSGLNLQDTQAQTQLFKLFVEREILYQEAIKQKIDQIPEVAAIIDEQKRQEIAKAIVEQHLKSNPITEVKVKEFYDKEYSANTFEYKIRHIQVENEADAKSVITKLEDGDKFVELADKLSKDSSGSTGGDLGWHSLSGLPAGFAEAIETLEANQHAPKPIQSDVGWHIVKVDEKRPLAPPPYESAKHQIFSQLQNQAVADFIASIKERAKIEIKQ